VTEVLHKDLVDVARMRERKLFDRDNMPGRGIPIENIRDARQKTLILINS